MNTYYIQHRQTARRSTAECLLLRGFMAGGEGEGVVRC